MQTHELTDEQWLVLDLLMRARQKGVHRLNRMELLNSNLSDGVKLKLTWAALTIPKDIITWHGQHDFSICEAGIQLFNLRFGKNQQPAMPTTIADSVIYLPGPEHYSN